MSARTVRTLAAGICVAAIAGMIVSAVLGSTGGALTAGLVAATAVLCSIVATAVAGPRPAAVNRGDPARLEALVQRLVDSGAPEEDVRALVDEARRWSSSSGPNVPI